MRRFRNTTRAAQDSAATPSVRYVYDRPLPYARHLRIEILGPDGSVVSTLISSYVPGQGWVTQTSTMGAEGKSSAA